MSDITLLGPILAATIKAFGENSERSQQSRDGIIGPSDLGFCRNKAALMIRGVEQSDSSNIAAAQVGTAVHSYVAEAFKTFGPKTWIVDNRKVTATFPSGVEVTGTPDLILPDYNAIIDVKTVDGFSWIKREGVSQNHKWQRHTYAMGAIAAGLLDDSKTVWVGNYFIDRSGKEPEPMFLIEEMDPTLTNEIDSWIGDVTYAVKNGEEAMRDIPAPVCERICSYFTECRGGLPVNDGQDVIEDDDLKAAIRMYVEARDLEKDAGKMKREAQARLYGVNGTDGEWQVRWTHINPSTVDSFEKAAYERMDVRKIRR